MTNPFQVKKISVPGVLSDDALQEQLKQFTSQQNAQQNAAPPPSSAVDFIDRIQKEYLNTPMPKLRAATAAMPGPLGLLANAAMGPIQPQGRSAQQKAIDVRSDILSEGAANLGSGGGLGGQLLRNVVLGPVVGLLGEGGVLNRLGTLSPEEQQAEAEKQQADAQANETAIRDHAAMRDQLRNLSDEDAQQMGIPVAPGGTDQATLDELAAQDARVVGAAEKTSAEKDAAVKDRAKQPTQTWWLDLLQRGAVGAAQTGIGTARALTEVAEAARDFTGVDLLTGGGRSTARAWVDTVDQTLTKMLPGDKTRSKEFLSQLGQAGGSFAGFLIGGYLAAAAGLPAKAATAIIGGAVGADQQFTDAEDHGATGLQKYLAFIAGGVIGLTEAIPIDRMFMTADAATGGLVRRMLNTTVAGSATEFLQEFGQAVGQDVVAKMLYDSSRDMDVASWLKQGALGAITGGLGGAAIHALSESGVSQHAVEADAQAPATPQERETIVLKAIDDAQARFDQVLGSDQITELPRLDLGTGELALEQPADTVQGKGGSIPVNANGMFEAHHSSSQQLDEIDPAKRGTGPLVGQERRRLGSPGSADPNVVDRSYFGVGDPDFPRRFAEDMAKLPPRERRYKEQTDPYHGEGLGPVRHTVEVDPNTIYNWYEDPQGLRDQLDKTAPMPEQVTRYEKLIKDAGFKGVYFDHSTLGQTAIMFDKVKPSRIVDQNTGLRTDYQVPDPKTVELAPEDTTPLPSLPKSSTGPIASVVQAARAYAEARGIPVRRQAEYVKADPARGKRIAEAYEKMKHAPNSPKVKAAYKAMADETLAQWEFVKATGLKVDFIKEGQPDPYPEGPKQVLADLQNGHLWVFPTESGFGTLNDIKDNPLLAPTGEVIDGHELLVNDVFRIVHDFFGHGIEGSGFGPSGEENAWQSHMRLYSRAALPAVTSETRGQNSWVNFGPHGETNRANQRETVFADQKTGIMPSWTWTEGVAPDLQSDMLASEGKPAKPAWMQDILNTAAARKDAAAALAADGKPVKLFHADGRYAMAGPDMSKPGGFRLTRFDDSGPVGHTEHATLAEAVDEGLREKYAPADPVVAIEQALHEFDSGRIKATEARKRIEATGWTLDTAGLRGNRKSVGVFDPEGNHHDLFGNEGQPVRTGPLPLFPDRTDQSFDRWFGDSKVVNDDGTPKVVFHGTPTKDGFRVFDPTRSGITSVLFSSIETHRNGFFFAENKEFADSFAAQKGAGKTMPVFLSIKHPLDVTESLNTTVAALEAIGERAAEIDPSITDPGFFADRAGRDDFWEVLDTPEGGDAFVQAAKEMGYDGIRMYEPNHDTRDSELVWVAFDNTQIKSAEENTGAYSPTNPDIHMALGTSNARGPQKAEQTRPSTGIETPPGDEAKTDVSLSKISRNFITLLDLTARQGRITLKGSKGNSVLGQYSRKQDVVRLKTWNDLTTLVHEGGHALYFSASDKLKQFVAGNEQQLMDVATALYGGDTNVMPRATHIAEGFAEFFRIYVTNRAFAERKYSTLTEKFTDLLLADAPQMKAGLDEIGQQFAAWLQLPSQQLIRNMIVPGKQDAGFNAALKELRDTGFGTWMQEYSRNVLQGTVNRYASLNAVVNSIINAGQENTGKALDVKRAEDPRVLIRLAQNAGARAMIQTTDGVMGYKSVDSFTRGLREALLRSQGLTKDDNLGAIDQERKGDFAAYLVALRGIDEYRRLAEGRIERPPLAATLGDLQVAVKEFEAKYGADFTDAAQIVNEYGMGLWKKSFDAGLMSKETYTDGLDRQFYAPLQRDMSDKKASLGASALTGGSSIVKRFRGSDRDIVDPMDVLLHKTFALEQIVAKNDVMKALASLADRAGKAGAMVERVPAMQLIGKQFSVKEVARQLTKDDTLTEADAQDLMEILQASVENDNVLSMFRSEQAGTKGENIVFYWEDGRLAALQLHDGDLGADVVNLMNGLGQENMPMFVDTIAAVSTAFRAGITSWPDFLLVNFIRDQMSAFILTDVGYKPFVSGLRGVGDEIRQAQWAKQYNAAMGIMGGMNVAALHDARINRDIASLRKKGYLAKAFNGNGLLGVARGMSNVVELTETGTRLGIFRAAYTRAKADGLSDWDASIEAGYTATDYIDFGLNGSRMLLFRKTIPFLNAQLQGLYKMMRTLGGDEVAQRKGLRFALGAYFKSINKLDLSRTEKQALHTGRKAWVKMAGLGFISAALHFLFEDDPDYQEAGEYLRTTGWVIPLGNGRIFYFPKPFELALVANFVERGLESASGDRQAKFRFMRGLAMTVVPPTSPPAIQIGVELAANYDFFSERQIVPDYMRALSPELQYTNYTTSLAKQLGAATGMSPMKIDHVLSGLGASAYRDLTAMYNTADPNRANMEADDAPILRRFIRDVRKGSASSRDFWKIASTVDGSLRSAEVSYKSYLESGNENAADAFLNTLDEDDRAYAILATHFKADAKRLNPFYRAQQITTIVSAMRREMVSSLGLEDTFTKFSEPIKLTGKEKADLDDALSEYARREMRNTLVAEDAPGWANKRMVKVDTTMDLIGSIEPRVREELERRLAKAKVYSFDAVKDYWPEARDRLIRDRENTFLKDLVTVAKVSR